MANSTFLSAHVRIISKLKEWVHKADLCYRFRLYTVSDHPENVGFLLNVSFDEVKHCVFTWGMCSFADKAVFFSLTNGTPETDEHNEGVSDIRGCVYLAHEQCAHWTDKDWDRYVDVTFEYIKNVIKLTDYFVLSGNFCNELGCKVNGILDVNYRNFFDYNSFIFFMLKSVMHVDACMFPVWEDSVLTDPTYVLMWFAAHVFAYDEIGSFIKLLKYVRRIVHLHWKSVHICCERYFLYADYMKKTQDDIDAIISQYFYDSLDKDDKSMLLQYMRYGDVVL